jgi:23S rRNA (adenine2030-N6)-methyltransferase
MNYRHAYHAGNFADVLKHAVLALIVEQAWYPIKDPKSLTRFHRALRAIDADKQPLRIEMMLRRPIDLDRLNGCGLVVLNPPHTLRDDLARILPELTRRLRDGGGARFDLAPIDGTDG